MSQNPQQTHEAHFSDPALDRVIRRMIDKPEGPVYKTDLLGISILAADSDDIRSLDGAENLVNLTTIDLFGCMIEDPKALASLKNLNTIELSRNNLTDLTSLEGLTNLSRIGLEENDISDLTPLRNLKNLKVLDISQNRISDLSPLSELPNLERLFISRNLIKDLSPLAGLDQLVIILLYKNQVSDLGPLLELKGLRNGGEIDLRDNPLSETARNEQISALQSMGINVRH